MNSHLGHQLGKDMIKIFNEFKNFRDELQSDMTSCEDDSEKQEGFGARGPTGSTPISPPSPPVFHMRMQPWSMGVSSFKPVGKEVLCRT